MYILTLLEGLVDGTTGNLIGLVNEAGQTVQGINLSGSGTTSNPVNQPGAAGCDIIIGTPQGETPTRSTVWVPTTSSRAARGATGSPTRRARTGCSGRDSLNAKDGQRGDILKGRRQGQGRRGQEGQGQGHLNLLALSSRELYERRAGVDRPPLSSCAGEPGCSSNDAKKLSEAACVGARSVAVR